MAISTSPRILSYNAWLHIQHWHQSLSIRSRFQRRGSCLRAKPLRNAFLPTASLVETLGETRWNLYGKHQRASARSMCFSQGFWKMQTGRIWWFFLHVLLKLWDVRDLKLKLVDVANSNINSLDRVNREEMFFFEEWQPSTTQLLDLHFDIFRYALCWTTHHFLMQLWLVLEGKLMETFQVSQPLVLPCLISPQMLLKRFPSKLPFDFICKNTSPIFYDMAVFWWFSLAHNLHQERRGKQPAASSHHWQLHPWPRFGEQNFNVSMQSVKLFHSGCAINVSWNCLEKDGGCTEWVKSGWTGKERLQVCWWKCCWIQLIWIQSILSSYQESISKSLSCFGRHWQIFHYERKCALWHYRVRNNDSLDNCSSWQSVSHFNPSPFDKIDFR